MKKRARYSLIVLVVSLGIVYGIAYIGTIFTVGETNGAWYQSIKPALTPPNWVFPIVWNILFFLIGLSLWISWVNSTKRDKRKVALWYGVNLVLNASWSIFYFGLHLPSVAFVDLILVWLSIIGMINVSLRTDKLAGMLLLPYFLWVSFASILNYLSI